MAVMRSGKLWGISYCVTFTLKVKYIKKSKLNMTVGEDGGERATDTKTEAADIHEKQSYLWTKAFCESLHATEGGAKLNTTAVKKHAQQSVGGT